MELTVSPAPHIHDNLTVSKCMYNVIIALLPAFAVSLYFFGIGALIVTLSSILSCVIVEYLIQKYLLKEKPSIGNEIFSIFRQKFHRREGRGYRLQHG